MTSRMAEQRHWLTKFLSRFSRFSEWVIVFPRADQFWATVIWEKRNSPKWPPIPISAWSTTFRLSKSHPTRRNHLPIRQSWSQPLLPLKRNLQVKTVKTKFFSSLFFIYRRSCVVKKSSKKGKFLINLFRDPPSSRIWAKWSEILTTCISPSGHSKRYLDKRKTAWFSTRRSWGKLLSSIHSLTVKLVRHENEEFVLRDAKSIQNWWMN